MPRKARLCDNCGANLQVAHTWRRLVVCGTCYAQLTAPRPEKAKPGPMRPLWPILAAAIVLAVGVGLTIVVIRVRAMRGAALASASGGRVAGEQSPQPRQIALPGAPSSGRAQSPPTSRPEAASSATEPASMPATATIRGVAHLVRKDGTFKVLPQVPLQLLAPTIRRKAVQSGLEAEARAWKDVADVYSGRVEEARQSDQAAVDSDGSADDQRIADEATAAQKRAQAAVDQVPAELDTADAFATLAELSVFNVPQFDDAIADGTLLDTRTDSEGNYEFRDIPPGDYYLHAARTDGSSFMEWCVPVHVEEGTQAVTIDLSDKNAAVVYDSN